MSRRLACALVVVIALVASSCSNENLGRKVPGCVDDTSFSAGVTGAIILQMQAVETAEYVPCINLLPQGWEYRDLVPERGKSRFWMNSDRVGTHFLEITLRDSCDVGSAPELEEEPEGVRRFRAATLVPTGVTITMIPVTDRELDKVREFEDRIEASEFNGRRPFVILDRQDLPITDRIEAAQDQGQAVIVMGELDVARDTAGLLLPDQSDLVRGLALDEVLDRLDGGLAKPSFKGSWFDVFEGGCIQYEFDADGAGVERLADDVESAIGLFPAGVFRAVLIDLGILG